jgi:hypothetical protein
MNEERFRELARQAGVLIDWGEDIKVGRWGIGGNYKNMQKFAELIIRECCIALNPMLRDMISRRQGVDLIKLQFGMNPKEITTAMLDASIAQCEQELAKKKSGVE